jgi:DNA-directed RNA polymerase subunit M/transcription elongation factor TFIIS
MPPKKKSVVSAAAPAAAAAAPAAAAAEPSATVQRNTDVATEMADAPAKSPKAAPKSRKKAVVAEPSNVTAAPESAIAVAVEPEPEAAAPVPDLDAPESKSSAIRFCPTCRYYLFLQSGSNTLQRLCRNCRYTENDEKGGLVMEQSSETSEGYKILVNEFTRYDVRLPHIVKTLRCPEPACKTNQGEAESDILYIKYDAANLKYLYICTGCGYQWVSKR